MKPTVIAASFFMLLFTQQTIAQRLSGGIGGAYNNSITQFGYDVRLDWETKLNFGFNIDFLHYGPGVKRKGDNAPVNEYYLNMNIYYNLREGEKYKLYPYIGYVFSRWINERPSGPGDYLGANGGLGFEYYFSNSSIFAEALTNSIWWEGNFIIGFKKDISFKKIFREGTKSRYNLELQKNKQEK